MQDTHARLRRSFKVGRRFWLLHLAPALGSFGTRTGARSVPGSCKSVMIFLLSHRLAKFPTRELANALFQPLCLIRETSRAKTAAGLEGGAWSLKRRIQPHPETGTSQ